MRLRDGGVDIFYIDESHDRHVFVTTAICIPFLRQIDGEWTFVWEQYLTGAKEWRRRMSDNHKIPVSKELHGVNLASGRGNYVRGKHNFDKPKAGAVYRRILEDLDFLPENSVMSAGASRGRYLYGNERLTAAMYALFQRMRTKCARSNVNALTFFDQGHPEYRTLYRQARVYLQTGSQYGGWGDRQTRNMPLSMFVKDGNEKDSKFCHFTQIADLIAYAAFLKLKSERGNLEEWQARLSSGNIYESLSENIINPAVSPSRDGIKRLT